MTNTRYPRMAPEVRTNQMLAEALKLAERKGFFGLTRADLAAACGVTPAMVNHRFGTLTKMKRAIMRAAITHKNLSVLAQGIVLKDSTALKAPKELQAAALGNLKK